MMRYDHTDQTLALVVDDNPETLGMISDALEDNGMTVLVARNGESALDLARRVNPDVILMDAIMPGLDGFETCRQLKSGDTPTEAPIVFMTGLTESEHIVRGLNAGGVDYITKPVVIEELLARLTIHIVNAKMIKSAREALDSSGRALLAFGRQGSLRWGSPNAVHRLRDAVPEQPSHPDRQSLKEWLLSMSARPMSEAEPLEINSLRLNFVGVSSAGEYLVKLGRPRHDSNEDRLASAFGLTRRESQVLFWLSLGKTNRDIGAILSLSARTVNKHLEQIFQKMGVDNRTAAAVQADRLLHADD